MSEYFSSQISLANHPHQANSEEFYISIEMLSKDCRNLTKKQERITINKTLGTNLFRGMSQLGGFSDSQSANNSLKVDSETVKLSKTMNCNSSPKPQFPSNLKKILEDPNFEAFFSNAGVSPNEDTRQFGLDFQQNIFKRNHF